jgi:Domain of unknown function (DUF4440)
MRGLIGRRGLLRSALALAPVLATTRGHTMQNDTTHTADLETLRALNARFIHNFVTNDVPSHDAITHERFLCIGTDGSRQGKAAYLRDWAHGFDPDVIPYWDTRDERIDVFGDVALVRATNKWLRLKAGQEITGMTTYTDTYLREGAGWLCIQAQLTAVAPAQYPGDQTIVSIYIRGQKQRRT